MVLSNNTSDEKDRTTATSSSTMNDATIAQVLQTLETLTTVFQFTPNVAQQAVEAVGPNVASCCDYILDHSLGTDRGGPIVPMDHCPHIPFHVKLSPECLPSPWSRCFHGKTLKLGVAKGDFQSDGSCPVGENWCCLECGSIGCSRYINGHGLFHYEQSLTIDDQRGEDRAGHCVAVSLADLSTWCHACNAYIKDSSLDALLHQLEVLKFDKHGNSDADEDITETMEWNYDDRKDLQEQERPSTLLTSSDEESDNEDTSSYEFYN
jgi:Zn-finger in ubiquitin-hydrolases and other protein